MDGFGGPATAFDVSGKSAPPLHHRAFVEVNQAIAHRARVPDQTVIRAEVRVESAIRQSCPGHHPRHSRGGDTLPPELLAAAFSIRSCE
jgi:hypothetical protein